MSEKKLYKCNLCPSDHPGHPLSEMAYTSKNKWQKRDRTLCRWCWRKLPRPAFKAGEFGSQWSKRSPRV